MTPTVHHIPVCPFSQRIEILLELKGLHEAFRFHTVDITKPRDPKLLELAKGSTALPVMEIPGRIALKESRVLLDYVEALHPDPPVARPDPYEHALESLIIQREGPFGNAGYGLVMNQDPAKRDAMSEAMRVEFRTLDRLLNDYAPGETYVFDQFGWAECVFTPFFMRFWFLEYYEGFELPETPEFARVRRWRDACLEHPAAQQVSREQVIKLYYDYAKGAGNGALLPGRRRSSFIFEPDWRVRPMPPADKYGHAATDTELGLV